MRGDHLLERHEALAVGHHDEAREQRRDLHPGEALLAGLGVADRDREVEREVRDVRERVGRVHRERGEHREDARVEHLDEVLAVVVVELVPVGERDADVFERGRDLLGEELGLAGDELVDRGARSRRAARAGPCPSGVVVRTPAATCSCRPETRTWTNSSRLVAKIARNLARSSSGRSASSASASTRALKSSQESSRFSSRPGSSAAAPAGVRRRDPCAVVGGIAALHGLHRTDRLSRARSGAIHPGRRVDRGPEPRAGRLGSGGPRRRLGVDGTHRTERRTTAPATPT